MNDDEKYSNDIFHFHVAKAKKEKDTLELARAYRYNSWGLNDIEEKLINVDSAITIAGRIHGNKDVEYDKFMALSLYTKASILYENYKEEKAVETFIQCFQYAKRSNYHDLTIRTLSILSSIKAEFGQESEAIMLQRKTLDFLEKRKHEIEDYQDVYMNNLRRMARCYAYKKETDSARFYANMAIRLAKATKQTSIVEDIQVLLAQVNYYDGNFIKAKDTLQKYEKYEDGASRADIQYYLGMIEDKLDNDNAKKIYFRSFDSIMETINYPLLDNSNEVYQYLLKEAIKNDEKHLVDKYLDRLVYYDSLLLTTQKNLREITLQKFDLPMQEEEKALLGQVISSQNKWLTWLYITTGAMLVGLSAYYIKYTKAKKRLVHAMNHDIRLNSDGYKRSKQVEENKLDGDTATMVLESLKVWEAQKGFLDNTVTQQTLAKKLNTNSSYLSMVVNTYKGQNFANYLKDLRITHAINHLKENPEIVKTKSIIQIAEMYGFNSLGVFSEAFKSKIGVTPGKFFKQVLEEDLKKTLNLNSQKK